MAVDMSGGGGYSSSGLKQWFYGLGLIGLLWGAYAVKPRVGAAMAFMVLAGVILWQAKNKKGLFALA